MILKVLKQPKTILLLFITLVNIWIIYICYDIGYDKGWNKGAEQGICAALDTVKTILDSKSFNTNTVKAVHLDDDTIWYDLRLPELKNSIK